MVLRGPSAKSQASHMSSGASESCDVEDGSRLQSQAVDAFPPEADVMGAALSGNLNVPFRRTPEESLTGWFARTEQPEELQSGEDHINVDIADFIFGQRRF